MDLNYEVHGVGDPIVMIHSPGVDMREWTYIVPYLSQTNQVVIFDVRGTGNSPAPISPSNFVDDLRKLLDYLRINTATLVGHSMGGQIATDFTLTFPSRVKQLVLIAPSLTGFQYSREFTEWMEQVNAAAPNIKKLANLSLSGPNYSITMSSKQKDFLYEMTIHYMTKVFSEWENFEIIWPVPHAIDRLHEIKVPLLFIQGDKEWSDQSRIADHFKKVKLVHFFMIKGADHMLTLTHPKEIAYEIMLFLQKGLSKDATYKRNK
ncbi:alpha/beta hydrolase [Bacillus sp. SM2101]|uniref:alpha/beta fold hydrolase n=1 Tax=Bacillus sp. SM2101 TaxID=2805366 RepID=UPI001BDEFECB|nr:alpha/beta hydrolase [Bacillus sp. SM2101]